MKKPQKTPKHFCCKKCGFTSRNKKDYTRHLSTTKHKMDNMDNPMDNPLIHRNWHPYLQHHPFSFLLYIILGTKRDGDKYD